MAGQHQEPGDAQDHAAGQYAAWVGALQQAGEEQHRVDAQHHQTALGEHQRHLSGGEIGVALALQHDAEFKAGKHEHDHTVENPERQGAAPGCSVVIGCVRLSKGGRCGKRCGQAQHHQRAERGRECDHERGR